jgi:hypothetical protein
MRNPDIYKVSKFDIKNWPYTETEDNRWIPARPCPFYGSRFFRNIKISWFVFIGKYDVLDWEDYEKLDKRS